MNPKPIIPMAYGRPIAEVEAEREAEAKAAGVAVFTADTITDQQIEDLFASLPPGHYAVTWCLDARFPSASHPNRQRNARQQCAELLNARRPK